MAKKDDDHTSKDREHFDNFIADYQVRYGEQMDLARTAALTTGTPGWQANFEAQTKVHRELVRSATNIIVSTAEYLKIGEPTEGDEKAIKDAVKQITEERIRFDSWMARAVEPYRRPVKTAETIREQCTRAAAEMHRLQPLISSKLVDQVREEMKRWPVATWNETTGVVTVDERKAGEQREAA